MIRTQAAAIPYRRDEEGNLEVLLVTSRRRGRWVLPKGKIKWWTLAHKAAADEAFEEAGVLGSIACVPAVLYRQIKYGKSGEALLAVRAFPLLVNTELHSWPEEAIRKRRWMSTGEAETAVSDASLRAMIRVFAAQYASADPHL